MLFGFSADGLPKFRGVPNLSTLQHCRNRSAENYEPRCGRQGLPVDLGILQDNELIHVDFVHTRCFFACRRVLRVITAFKAPARHQIPNHDLTTYQQGYLRQFIHLLSRQLTQGPAQAVAP